MIVLSESQRQVVRADTNISRILIDRVSDAYSALIDGDAEKYKGHMTAALLIQGLPVPIPEHERPTAIDVVKTIAIKSIADQRGWTFKRAARYLEDAAS